MMSRGVGTFSTIENLVLRTFLFLFDNFPSFFERNLGARDLDARDLDARDLVARDLGARNLACTAATFAD